MNVCRHSATVNVDCWMTAVECAVYREIEKNIDLVNNLRRDKYIIEGKLKKYVDQNFTEQSSYVFQFLEIMSNFEIL